MNAPRHPLKPFAAGNSQRDHDREGVVTVLPDGARLSVPGPLAYSPDFDAEETEFLRAMDAYKSRNGRRFPTLRETLAVLKSLGYRKETT